MSVGSVDTRADERATRLEPLLGGLTPAAWDDLAGRNFYSSAAWLGFCATDFGGRSGAAVSCRDGAPVCAVPFAEAGPSLLSLYRWRDVLTGYGLPAPPAAGVLVGPREGYQTHILGAGEATSAEVQALVGLLREAQARGGDPATRACVAMYVTTADALTLQRAGVTATPVLLEVDAWIEVPEGGWDAWEASLSAKRRYSVHREIERFRSAGYQVELRPLSDCCEQLGEIACATLAKYGHRSRPEDELRALRNHVAAMGDAARTALLRTAGGVLVGFALYYVWRDTIFLRWAGLDYERLAGADEYFNLCFYALIELASELGLGWLHPGLKSTEAKALRGARLRPLWLVDLAEDSVLAGAAAQVRGHNARVHRQYKADPRTSGAVDDRAWEPFL